MRKRVYYLTVRNIISFYNGWISGFGVPSDQPATRQFPGRWLVERGPYNAKLRNGHTASLFFDVFQSLVVSDPDFLSMTFIKICFAPLEGDIRSQLIVFPRFSSADLLMPHVGENFLANNFRFDQVSPEPSNWSSSTLATTLRHRFQSDVWSVVFQYESAFKRETKNTVKFLVLVEKESWYSS